MTEHYTDVDVLRVRTLGTIRSSRINLENVAKTFRDDEASMSEMVTAIADMRGVAKTLVDMASEIDRKFTAMMNDALGDLPDEEEVK